VAIANQLQPKLDPRHITSVEERDFVAGPQRRISDVWIQKDTEAHQPGGIIAADSDTAVILEVEDLEIHEKRVEILDAYNGLKLIALIEVASPTNKTSGPGRASYEAKQQEALAGDCHLAEIDLLRRHGHVVCVPEWRVESLKPFDSLCCVNRWPQRSRFELYPRRLRERLPRLAIPLADGDPDVSLDVQVALEQVYADGRYGRRVRYDRPCDPALDPDDQAWCDERITVFRAARPRLSPEA
jgi:hypothetical protein